MSSRVDGKWAIKKTTSENINQYSFFVVDWSLVNVNNLSAKYFYENSHHDIR